MCGRLLYEVLFVFIFSVFPPFIFSAQRAITEQVPGDWRLKLMTSHVCRHHGATKAWQNDRSCLQYVLTNKLVRRCFALHNRCGGCRGTEQPTEKKERKNRAPSGPVRAQRPTHSSPNKRDGTLRNYCSRDNDRHERMREFRQLWVL